MPARKRTLRASTREQRRRSSRQVLQPDDLDVSKLSDMDSESDEANDAEDASENEWMGEDEQDDEEEEDEELPSHEDYEKEKSDVEMQRSKRRPRKAARVAAKRLADAAPERKRLGKSEIVIQQSTMQQRQVAQKLAQVAERKLIRRISSQSDTSRASPTHQKDYNISVVKDSGKPQPNESSANETKVVSSAWGSMVSGGAKPSPVAASSNEAILDHKHIRPGSKGKTNPLKKTMGVLDIKPTWSSVINRDPILSFYADILDWDIRLELGKALKSSKTSKEDEHLQIPDKFRDHEHYFSVWRPLAVQEIFAQSINTLSAEGIPDAIPIKVATSSSSVQEFVKVKLFLNKDAQKHRKDKKMPLLIKEDLVLLTDDPNYLSIQGPIEEGEAVSGRAALGLVILSSQSRDGPQVRLLSRYWNQLSGKRLYMFKINNLITSMREFTSLCKCKDYPLLPLLLSGEQGPPVMKFDSLGMKFVDMLRRGYNRSQLEAIEAAAISDGFTLIKGPPGTGKTTTLKALLNSLHLREYNRYYDAVCDVALRPDHETAAAWAAIGNKKPHILVAAPSNAAVDNIVAKIMEDGFCDGEGRLYYPNIVRVGRGRSEQSSQVSLDVMIKNILQQPDEAARKRLWGLRDEQRRVEMDSHYLRNELRNVVRWLNTAHCRPKESPESPPPPPPEPLSPVPPSDPQALTPPPPESLSPVPPPDSQALTPPPPTESPVSEKQETPPPSAAFSPAPGSAASGESPVPVAAFTFSPPNPIPEHADADEDDEVMVTLPPPDYSKDGRDGVGLPAVGDDESEEDEPIPPPPPPEEAPNSPPVENPPLLPPQTQAPSEQQERRPISPAEYCHFPSYAQIAGKLNKCLERLNDLKLEIERYEFVRRMRSETGIDSYETKQHLETSFLDSAHIVFTTLSSAGLSALDSSLNYDVLVVDEAAQAVELSNLIPMRFGSRQCVLVGDPQQLSATVFSRTSAQTLYERSLFERLENCGHPVHMLSVQYRSHPAISKFPRQYFYHNKLEDGPNVLSEAYSNKPYTKLSPAFKPLMFFDLLRSEESSFGSSGSRRNLQEVDLAVNLYTLMKETCPFDVVGKVGVITPYSQQQFELRRRFEQMLGPKFELEVEINTVDGFQGREKDIIILSTVRADQTKGVGFLSDIRRMNVALTRAKFACFVLGSEVTLKSSRPWRDFLDFVWNEKSVVQVDDPRSDLRKVQIALNRSKVDRGRALTSRNGNHSKPGHRYPKPEGHQKPNKNRKRKNNKRSNGRPKLKNDKPILEKRPRLNGPPSDHGRRNP